MRHNYKALIVSFWVVAGSFFASACTPESPRESVGGITHEFAGSGQFFLPTDAPAGEPKWIYLPVYSNIYLSGTGRRELAATLSIRNTDSRQSIVISRVEYYDSSGALIEVYLDRPHQLKPMASTTLVVAQKDTRGGSGANFLIQWHGDTPNPPIFEAIMAGVSGTHSLSFVTEGKAIEKGPQEGK